ncbi:hypothetical protein J2TS6_07990 [Paenibacillus albilobatus]|uniref:Uncharacterized protein n=1 Tax=Paenibacillus albilobatus TaxID=2716884 RepID=A0A919XFV2_9BACL|nr:hypothetical protein J2TS6_07990 [Paenibacillus albilobatus]
MKLSFIKWDDLRVLYNIPNGMATFSKKLADVINSLELPSTIDPRRGIEYESTGN